MLGPQRLFLAGPSIFELVVNCSTSQPSRVPVWCQSAPVLLLDREDVFRESVYSWTSVLVVAEHQDRASFQLLTVIVKKGMTLQR
jgi:hypothetical protein